MKTPIKTLVIALVIAALTVTFLFAGCTATREAVLPPVRIPSSEEVDSLNLAIAAAIGMYAFRIQ